MIIKERALATNQLGWERVGTIDATAAGADNALDEVERFFSSASLLDNSVAVEVSNNINAVEIRYLLTNNDADVDLDIWATKENDENLELVCTVDVIAGQQESDDGKLYADTANLSNDEGWAKRPKSKVAGVDYIAVTRFDLCGRRRLLIHGYGVFSEDCIIEISGY